MNTVKTIDIFDSLGNPLADINGNFQLFNFRLCDYNTTEAKMRAFTTLMQNNSALYQQLYTTTNTLSAGWRDTTNTVSNLEGYWLTPLSLIYPKTFAYIGNYSDILYWLNNTVQTVSTGQIANVTFFVKNYDPDVLNNTAVSNITIEAMNAVSAALGFTTKNIQTFIIYKNHVDVIISTINNIFRRENRADLIIKSSTTIPNSNTFQILNRTLSHPEYATFKQYSINQLYTLIYQWELLAPTYNNLVSQGLNTISPDILSKFNTQNIYNTYSGVFSYIKRSTGWEYIPNGNINFCTPKNDKCFTYIDPNTYYTGTDCASKLTYELAGCNGIYYLSRSAELESYIGKYIDAIIKGQNVKCLVNYIQPRQVYDNENILFGTALSILKESIYQDGCSPPVPIPPTTTPAPYVPPPYELYEGYDACPSDPRSLLRIYTQEGYYLDDSPIAYLNASLTTKLISGVYVEGIRKYITDGLGVLTYDEDCATTTTTTTTSTTPMPTTTLMPTTSTTTSTSTTTTTVVPTTSTTSTSTSTTIGPTSSTTNPPTSTTNPPPPP